MEINRKAIGAFALSASSLIWVQGFAAPTSCESLASLGLPDTTITTAATMNARMIARSGIDATRQIRPAARRSRLTRVPRLSP